MAYRMTKKGVKSLTNAVRKFNAKITRMSKDPSLQGVRLPQRKNVQQLRKEITSSKDYRNALREMQRIFNKGASEIIEATESGFRLTKYEYKEGLLKDKRDKLARKKFLESKQPSVLSGARKGLKQYEAEPRQTMNFNKMSEEDWIRYTQVLHRRTLSNYTREKGERYKQSYLKAIRNQLGQYGRELFEYVANIPPEIIWEAYYDSQLLELEFYYMAMTMANKASASLEEWKGYYYIDDIKPVSEEYEKIWTDKEEGQ